MGLPHPSRGAPASRPCPYIARHRVIMLPVKCQVNFSALVIGIRNHQAKRHRPRPRRCNSKIDSDRGHGAVAPRRVAGVRTRSAVGSSSLGVSARGIDADVNTRNDQQERRERGASTALFSMGGVADAPPLAALLSGGLRSSQHARRRPRDAEGESQAGSGRESEWAREVGWRRPSKQQVELQVLAGRCEQGAVGSAQRRFRRAIAVPA